MDAKDKEKLGLVQVYTGDGKGKSTAAFGLALRAAGGGMHVVIIQFMKKGEWYGEIVAFKRLPEIEIYSFGSDKFLKKGNRPDEQNINLAEEAMAKARAAMDDDSVDILILDELNNAIYFDLISEEDVLDLIQAKPQHQELIITGRNASEKLIAAADLVTEMREIKHPYRLQGIQARRGIEY